MTFNKIGQQFHAMFGVFMVAFYLGIGIFILFFADKYFVINKALRGLIGSTFVLYGLFRIYVTYKLIVGAFFTSDEDSDEA